MIDFEFEYELHSGIAEALDAAGVDDHVPSHDNDLRARCEDAWEAASVDDRAVVANSCVSSAHAIDAQASSAPPIVDLDLRALPAPEPMVRALAAADALAPGATLLLWTPLLPSPLLQALAERGFDARAHCLPDGTAHVAIRHQSHDRSAHAGDDGQARA